MKKRIFALLLALVVLCMAGCSGETPDSTEDAAPPASTTQPEAKLLDMQALYTDMSAKMPEMIVLDDSMMLNYCGIDAADCVQAVVAICADGLLTDEVWLLEAKDADALARLESMAQSRLQYKAEESESYSPEQYAVVQKAKVIAQGNYLLVLVSPDVDALESLYRTAAGLN